MTTMLNHDEKITELVFWDVFRYTHPHCRIPIPHQRAIPDRAGVARSGE
jgi:hypothetical protein